MLEISSRNSVPPAAISNLPGLLCCAPVKAPFSYPNSSLSTSVSGIAPQSTGTKGPSARRLALWMPRATSSLPEPVSPRIRTVKFERATVATSVQIRCTLRLGPISS